MSPRVKTPTAAAAFLIDRLEQVARRIDDAADRITSYVQHRMEIEKMRLSRAAERIPILFSLVKSKQENKMEALNQRIASAVQRLIDRRRHTLDILEQRTKSLDPTLLLQRGYSITLVNGHALRSPSAVKPGDIIVTRLADGTVKSTVNETKKI